MKLVSLIPSASEIVYALGAQDHLVGRSHECDYPPEVEKLPALTETRFYPEGSSYEIDERVKAVVREASSVYRIDEALLKQLDPDVILTQSQCEVCAVSSDQLETMIRERLEKRLELLDMRIDRLDDLYSVIESTGKLIDKTGDAKALNEKLKAEFAEMANAVPKDKAPPKVAFIEWMNPVMTAGHWVPELADMAGVTPVESPKAGEDSVFVSLDEVASRDPDYIILIPCGYSIQDTIDDLDSIRNMDAWKHIKAVNNDQVFIADGNQYFNRPGPRLTTALRSLCEIFHPEVFQPKYRDSAWVKVK